jgi:TfoX/Sxy family transcriptional regulator of competence genes
LLAVARVAQSFEAHSVKTKKPVQKATPLHDLVARVREALSPISDVKEKKMFGSVAFMVHGKMCVTARAERIMCRIDPALHDAAIKRPGVQAVVMRGRSYRGYVYVAAEALNSKRELIHWIRLVLEHNPPAEPTPPPSRLAAGANTGIAIPRRRIAQKLAGDS